MEIYEEGMTILKGCGWKDMPTRVLKMIASAKKSITRLKTEYTTKTWQQSKNAEKPAE